MDFKDSILQLAERVTSLKESIQTEEATKNAFIMPFIQILGYDVFNPLEVVPEMDCDITKKKGEKIDYAIMKDGSPIMLIECKHWKQDLNLHDNQLKRYYVASKAKFGVLTNGIVYRFYADLIKENIMDDVPFLEINLEKIRETQIEEVKKFCKENFDLDNILSSANELKYMSEVKKVVRSEFAEPSPEFVKMLTKRVYEGIVTQKVLDQFTDIVMRALKSHINDVMSEKLGIAIKATEAAGAPIQTPSNAAEQKEDEEGHHQKGNPIALINPEIIYTSEETIFFCEGCLSIPEQRADVERFQKIKVRYQDTTGAVKEIEAEDYLAVVLQHEIDHLDGILYIDHLSRLKRNMLLKKLEKARAAKNEK